MQWLMRLLISRGISKGLVGGNRFFQALGLIAMAIRLAQKATGVGEKTLFSHEMRPGDKVVVNTTGHIKKKD